MLKKIPGRENFSNAGLKYLQKMHQTSGSEDILRRISIHAANQVITTKCSPAFLFHYIYV